MVFFNCGFIGIKGIISDLVKEKLKDIHGNKYSDDNYSYSYNGYLSLMDYYYTIMMDNAGMANDLVHWFINMTVLEWHCLYYLSGTVSIIFVNTLLYKGVLNIS